MSKEKFIFNIYNKIKTLPSTLKVGGDLFLKGTPIIEMYTEEEIRQMAPGISGKIYF
jgi:hypothetical protein